MTDAPKVSGAAGSGLAWVDRTETLRGLDGLLVRHLTPPRSGLILSAVAPRAPDMVARAEDVVRDGGLAILIDAAVAWKTDVASALIRAAPRHWPALDACRDRMRLAVHEAVVNAVLHGCLTIEPTLRDTSDDWLDYTEQIRTGLDAIEYGGRPVLVTLTVTPGSWIVRVEDEGPGFDAPGATHMATLEPGCVAKRGRGLLLMRAVCDSVSWENGGRTSVLTFTRFTATADARQGPADARHD